MDFKRILLAFKLCYKHELSLQKQTLFLKKIHLKKLRKTMKKKCYHLKQKKKIKTFLKTFKFI